MAVAARMGGGAEEDGAGRQEEEEEEARKEVDGRHHQRWRCGGRWHGVGLGVLATGCGVSQC